MCYKAVAICYRATCPAGTGEVGAARVTTGDEGSDHRWAKRDRTADDLASISEDHGVDTVERCHGSFLFFLTKSNWRIDRVATTTHIVHV